MLGALIVFMPTKGDGAIGSLDFPIEERKRLAKLSREFVCDKCNSHLLTLNDESIIQQDNNNNNNNNNTNTNCSNFQSVTASAVVHNSNTVSPNLQIPQNQAPQLPNYPAPYPYFHPMMPIFNPYIPVAPYNPPFNSPNTAP